MTRPPLARVVGSAAADASSFAEAVMAVLAALAMAEFLP
jgi:hypothetical protein